MNVPVAAAYAVAFASTLLLLRHVGRQYPSVPARVPLRIELDGRPSRRQAGKAVLWVAPGIMLAVVVLLGACFAVTPVPDEETYAMVLTCVTLVEVAWFVAWSTDRQIEIARKITYRVSPMRTLRVSLPLLATIALVLYAALRASG